jgi:hypothetical protein
MDSEDTMTDVRTHSSPLLRQSRTAAALTALVALGGVACARNATPAAAGAPVAAAAPGALPIAVNCGPGQQALIRPSVVNGQAISQVDCVTIAATTMAPAAVAPAPAQAAYPVSYPVAAPQPVAMSDVATIEERPVYRQARRPVAYQTREYVPERRVVKSGRSWQKSALIIGSSAGIGAGVGAAAGGKKGALIGAAVGGGGATIWDQVTRRN